MDDIQLAIEAALAVLLTVTIFYSLHLGKALSILRRDRSELATLIGSLERSSGEARTGIEQLRQATELSSRQLGKSLDHAKILRMELQELCRLGEELANRLEQETGSPRADTPPSRQASEGEAPVTHQGGKKRTLKSEAEQQLLRALRMQRA